MTNEEFNSKYLPDMLDHTKRVLAAKQGEYSANQDRMHNFKASAILQGLVTVNNQESAAWNLVSKQITSVIDMVNDDKGIYPYNHIQEKIGDVVNYFLLLGAMISDRIVEHPAVLNHTMIGFAPFMTEQHE